MFLVETSIFSRQIDDYLSEESYRGLQNQLVKNPESGKLIRGSGGIRKLRWSADGRGKSGGVRVIYYWASDEGEIFLLYMYPKNVQEDLTSDQLKKLCRLVREEFS